MKPKIKAAWVAALRSGEYKQGKGRLREGNAFCCLGVLCNLHAQAHPEIAAEEVNPFLYLGWKGSLPPCVQEWSGVTYSFGDEVLMKDVNLCLAGHNDEGCTFAEIADAIEGQL